MLAASMAGFRPPTCSRSKQKAPRLSQLRRGVFAVTIVHRATKAGCEKCHCSAHLRPGGAGVLDIRRLVRTEQLPYFVP